MTWDEALFVSENLDEENTIIEVPVDDRFQIVNALNKTLRITGIFQ